MPEYKIEWDMKKNTRLIEGKPHVFHCHHYNCHLQKTLEEAKMVDGKGIQINAAREVAFEQFSKAFSEHSELKTRKQKLAFASKLYQILGFGLINLDGLSEKGGTVKSPVSHYAKGWISKWGKRTTPVDFFTTGWIGGLVAAVFGKQRFYYEVTQTQCESVKGKGCTYKVEVR